MYLSPRANSRLLNDVMGSLAIIEHRLRQLISRVNETSDERVKCVAIACLGLSDEPGLVVGQH